MSSEQLDGEIEHAVTARATVNHYVTYRNADDVPVDQGRKPSLMEFDQNNTAHLAYRCECGEVFLKPQTAATHLREVSDAE